MGKRRTVETCTLDGRNYHTLLSTVGQHPFSIAVFQDEIFWTDWDGKSIQRANKFTGKLLSPVVRNGLHQPMGIAIYHPILQKGALNPCSKVHCSHLCLLSHTDGFKCACEAGV